MTPDDAAPRGGGPDHRPSHDDEQEQPVEPKLPGAGYFFSDAAPPADWVPHDIGDMKEVSPNVWIDPEAMADLEEMLEPGDEHYDPLDPEQDCFRPPAIPTLVFCVHCGEEYDSFKMRWELNDAETHGFWMCGTPGCDGKGYGFDIFPVDPDFDDGSGREIAWIEGDEQEEEELEELIAEEEVGDDPDDEAEPQAS